MFEVSDKTLLLFFHQFFSLKLNEMSCNVHNNWFERNAPSVFVCICVNKNVHIYITTNVSSFSFNYYRIRYFISVFVHFVFQLLNIVFISIFTYINQIYSLFLSSHTCVWVPYSWIKMLHMRVCSYMCWICIHSFLTALIFVCERLLL